MPLQTCGAMKTFRASKVLNIFLSNTQVALGSFVGGTSMANSDKSGCGLYVISGMLAGFLFTPLSPKALLYPRTQVSKKGGFVLLIYECGRVLSNFNL